jgi:hypothetical protein
MNPLIKTMRASLPDQAHFPVARADDQLSVLGGEATSGRWGDVSARALRTMWMNGEADDKSSTLTLRLGAPRFQLHARNFTQYAGAFYLLAPDLGIFFGSGPCG